MTGSTGGIVGGVLGTAIGIAGGIVRTYFSIKNTVTPAERAFMVRVAIAMWSAVVVLIALGALAIARVMPQWPCWVGFSLFMCLLGPAIVWGNKKQAKLRAEQPGNRRSP